MIDNSLRNLLSIVELWIKDIYYVTTHMNTMEVAMIGLEIRVNCNGIVKSTSKFLIKTPKFKIISPKYAPVQRYMNHKGSYHKP